MTQSLRAPSLAELSARDASGDEPFACPWPPLNVQHSLITETLDTGGRAASVIDRQRAAFLERLASSGRMPYKRYTESPIRYAGGKSLAVGMILSHMPLGVTRLVSPFLGGGSVEVACAKECGMQVNAYDLFGILTTYWNEQLHDAQALASTIGRWAPNKSTYNAVKQRLKAHWLHETPIDNTRELAAHYWFNHNLSYGPGFLGWMSKIYEERPRYDRMLYKVANFTCPGLTVQQGSFDDTIPRHMDDFLYCDPPYYLEGDSKMFRGIYPQRNFPVHHDGFDHEELATLLHSHRGGFVLSYNDCADIRSMYNEFEIHEVKWQYTLGQGETRIGTNRIQNGTPNNIKASHELLIVKVPST